jgi:hypothetical protein
MGFKKEGLLKAAIALTTLVSAYYLVDFVKHLPKAPVSQLEPKKEICFFKNIKEIAEEIIPDKLYIQKVTQGQGPRLAEYDLATFHILATNLLNEVILNTYESAPIQQILITTTDGFKEGVLGMRVGEKRILFIDPSIEPKFFNLKDKESAHIYEVELIQLEKRQ